jgi:catechol 2,3-dioxygenase-like lactoylglutathione lyase family enzyme
MERSREFYENVLGQKVRYDFGENIEFEGSFSIHLRAHFRQLIDNKEITSGLNNFELYFEHDDLEQMEEKLNNCGVEFVHKLREQPWKQKVMRFYDPDGHMIEVGESMEHLTYRLHREGLQVKKISQMTSMPESFIRESIKRYEGY